VFEKAMTASLGLGNDIFELEQDEHAGTSFFRGAVLLQGGAGADVFLIGANAATYAIAFNNKVTADGGADTDSLTQGTQVTFNPLFPSVVKISIP
jgi:hypothetical protein